jgi:hypothetical protein
MHHTEIANEPELMRGGSEQPRRLLGAQNPDWMRIERHDDGRATREPSRLHRAPDHGLMAEVHPIENPDREKQRTRQAPQLAYRAQDAGDRIEAALHDVSL